MQENNIFKCDFFYKMLQNTIQKFMKELIMTRVMELCGKATAPSQSKHTPSGPPVLHMHTWRIKEA